MTQITTAGPSPDDGAHSSDELLPLVYKELRALAAWKIQQKPAGQPLNPTSLVHEAYIRLGKSGKSWADKRHFLAAASLAMARILIDASRMRGRISRGGRMVRHELDDWMLRVESPVEDVVAFEEALELFGRTYPVLAELVRLRVYTGLSVEEAAEVVGLSQRTAYRNWEFARAWLQSRLLPGSPPPPPPPRSRPSDPKNLA